MTRIGIALATFTLAGAYATGSLLQNVPAAASQARNPFDRDPRAVRAGAKLYARECAACHGANREGGPRVPPLDREEVYNAAPGALFWVLRNGSLHHGMPTFAHLPEAQRWQIVTFLRNREAY